MRSIVEVVQNLIKPYIDSVKQALTTTTNSIAPTEDGTNYSKTYYKDDEFYRNGVLYKVTASSVNSSTVINTGSGGNATTADSITSQISPLAKAEDGEVQLISGLWIMRIGKIRILRFFSCSFADLNNYTLPADDRPTDTVTAFLLRGAESKYHCMCALLIGSNGALTGYMPTEYNANQNMIAATGSVSGNVVYAVAN